MVYKIKFSFSAEIFDTIGRNFNIFLKVSTNPVLPLRERNERAFVNAENDKESLRYKIIIKYYERRTRASRAHFYRPLDRGVTPFSRAIWLLNESIALPNRSAYTGVGQDQTYTIYLYIYINSQWHSQDYSNWEEQ